MAKVKQTKKKRVGGPYLAAAVFCQNILEDSQKSLSAINIVDGCIRGCHSIGVT